MIIVYNHSSMSRKFSENFGSKFLSLHITQKVWFR